MKTEQEKNSSLMFNLIALLGFLLGLFLIIFLKRGGSKKSEHSRLYTRNENSRVKISPTSVTKEKHTEKQKDSELENIKKKLNKRQLHILEIIEQEGEMEPSQIYDLVPNVSTRTVRRDMDVLVENNLVSQKGSTKATTYIYTGR